MECMYQIIETDNSIGTQFHITESFPDTVQLLHNFVRAKFESMRVRALTLISGQPWPHAHSLAARRTLRTVRAAVALVEVPTAIALY